MYEYSGVGDRREGPSPGLGKSRFTLRHKRATTRIPGLSHTYGSPGTLRHMKTTVNLPDALLEAAKRRAREQQRTVTSLIEEGLHRVLADTPDESTPDLPTWGTGEGRVLVDVHDREALWEALDADAPWPR